MTTSQEEFLRAVSHDLRAPLRHITSYSPLVRELIDDAAAGLPTEPRDEAQGFLNTMDQAARRMGRMLDGLLALSRVGRAPLETVALDLGTVVRDVQSALSPQAQGRPVEWTVSVQDVPMHGDAALVRQLLQELVGNALKFTSRHTAADDPARIAIKAQVRPGGGVVLQVQDNGVGFDTARGAALFGVFQRLHREGDFEGVGAGLATARAIALRHGATVAITAVPGVGCTVTVEWPAAG
ncbi:MAG: two-component sensor histidine kinase [Comamonadaceae bacterium]|nr:MAG: two-component sensor histidine kinase [Comamonadaceae bacterium]